MEVPGTGRKAQVSAAQAGVRSAAPTIADARGIHPLLFNEPKPSLHTNFSTSIGVKDGWPLKVLMDMGSLVHSISWKTKHRNNSRQVQERRQGSLLKTQLLAQAVNLGRRH